MNLIIKNCIYFLNRSKIKKLIIIYSNASAIYAAASVENINA